MTDENSAKTPPRSPPPPPMNTFNVQNCEFCFHFRASFGHIQNCVSFCVHVSRSTARVKLLTQKIKKQKEKCCERHCRATIINKRRRTRDIIRRNIKFQQKYEFQFIFSTFQPTVFFYLFMLFFSQLSACCGYRHRCDVDQLTESQKHSRAVEIQRKRQ